MVTTEVKDQVSKKAVQSFKRKLQGSDGGNGFERYFRS